MTTLSHLGVGFLVTKYFVSRGLLPSNSVTPYLVGMAFANLPDLDGVAALTKIRTLYDHQHYFKSALHYPANWLVVFGLLIPLSLLYPVKLHYSYIALAAVNVFLHFILDTFSIYGGIAWLAPWNKKKYSFIKVLPFLPTRNREWISWYMKHWVMYLEVAIWVMTTIILGNARHSGGVCLTWHC